MTTFFFFFLISDQTFSQQQADAPSPLLVLTWVYLSLWNFILFFSPLWTSSANLCVLLCFCFPVMGLRVGEERRLLGARLPMGARAEPHADTNRPKPWNALGQVCVNQYFWKLVSSADVAGFKLISSLKVEWYFRIGVESFKVNPSSTAIAAQAWEIPLLLWFIWQTKIFAGKRNVSTGALCLLLVLVRCSWTRTTLNQ